ncbi:protein NLRC3-like isoform X1, partial [Clarias magur]
KPQEQRSESPAPSCISIKSEQSMDLLDKFKDRDSSLLHSKLQKNRSESSALSCISIKSDKSMDPPVKFTDGDSTLLHGVLQDAEYRTEKNIITDT